MILNLHSDIQLDIETEDLLFALYSKTTILDIFKRWPSNSEKDDLIEKFNEFYPSRKIKDEI